METDDEDAALEYAQKFVDEDDVTDMNGIPTRDNEVSVCHIDPGYYDRF